MSQGFFDILSERLTGFELIKNVLILGSGPQATDAEQYISADNIVVAVNNAWRAVSRVDFSVYSDDFPGNLKHPKVNVIGRSSTNYATAMDRYGGIFHCGATMAIAAGYWAIQQFPFSQVTFFGSDMVYSGQKTHFYQGGSSDPLRPDPTLQDLRAKTARLMYYGLASNVLFVNGSSEPDSRLSMPRMPLELALSRCAYLELWNECAELLRKLNPLAVKAIHAEATAPFDCYRYDYWNVAMHHEAWLHAAHVDSMWAELIPVISSFSGQMLSK